MNNNFKTAMIIGIPIIIGGTLIYLFTRKGKSQETEYSIKKDVTVTDKEGETKTVTVNIPKPAPTPPVLKPPFTSEEYEAWKKAYQAWQVELENWKKANNITT